MYPAWYVVLGLIIYAAAYWIYSRWYDRKVMESNPKATTPAHMYMDGVEFFPTSKYVLFGFQYKGIAALGPILGPFVALTYGWVPALLWILLGNFFIGWIHDYGAMMISMRNEGKTLGPLTYEFISPRARTGLMGFLLFYLLLISAVFVLFCGLFFNAYPQSVLPTLSVLIAGIIGGILLYKIKVNVVAVTIIGIIIMIIGMWLGVTYPIKYTGVEPLAFWMFIASILIFIGAVTPIIWYTQPVNYMAFYPCTFGVIAIIIGALLSPIWNIPVVQPAFTEVMPGGLAGAGPIWPILFVSIACGAISGWHSLVGSSGSSRQLDVETDATPVGAGSMLMEGLLALSALAAFTVLSGLEIGGRKHWVVFPEGATKLTANLFGGDVAVPVLTAFFATFLVLYALTVQQLVTRFWRLSLSEMTAARPTLRAVLGNKYVGAFLGLLIAYAFAYTGAWMHLWLLFGGSNQLLAGLALLLVSIYVARLKKSTIWSLGPALFMIITCEAALAWESFIFFKAVVEGTTKATGKLATFPALATGFDITFGMVGLVLFILGAIVAYDGFKALARARKAKPEKEE
ncbi:MAG: carbon starvation protein A [Candidatus Bathyarchaeia archaeon]